MSTKLHAACTSERTGVSFARSGGERHDTTGFEAVWEGAPGGLGVMAVVMDKAYDSHAIRRFLAMQGIEAVIPPGANRTGTIHYDPGKYQLREGVEWLFNKLKQFRRIATRYDKLGRTFLAFVHLAAIWIMVR